MEESKLFFPLFSLFFSFFLFFSLGYLRRPGVEAVVGGEEEVGGEQTVFFFEFFFLEEGKLFFLSHRTRCRGRRGRGGGGWRRANCCSTLSPSSASFLTPPQSHLNNQFGEKYPSNLDFEKSSAIPPGLLLCENSILSNDHFHHLCYLHSLLY